jgi:hypothetical protein
MLLKDTGAASTACASTLEEAAVVVVGARVPAQRAEGNVHTGSDCEEGMGMLRKEGGWLVGMQADWRAAQAMP